MLKFFWSVVIFSTLIFNSAMVSANKMPVIVINKFEQELDADISMIDAGEFISEVLMEQFMDTGKFMIIEREYLEELKTESRHMEDLLLVTPLLAIMPRVDYMVSGKVKVERVNEKIKLGNNFRQIAHEINFGGTKALSSTVILLAATNIFDVNKKNIRVTCEMNISDAETNKKIWSGKVSVMRNASAEISPELKIYQKDEGILCRNLIYISANEIVFGELCKSPDFEKMFESDKNA